MWIDQIFFTEYVLQSSKFNDCLFLMEALFIFVLATKSIVTEEKQFPAARD